MPRVASRAAVHAAWIALFGVAAVYGQCCDATGLNDTKTRTEEGINWTVRYSDNDPGDPNTYFTDTDADDVLDVLTLAAQRYATDWQMIAPRLDEPEFPDDANFLVKVEPGNGRFCKTCMVLDAANARARSAAAYPWVPSHELMHGRQWAYLRNAGADDGYGGMGGWVIEGTPRCLDDRITTDLDSVGPYNVDTNRLLDSSDGVTNYRDMSLFDPNMLYRACLFWGYGCEQYGNLDFEPDRGADFIQLFFQTAADDWSNDGIKDSIYTLGRALAARGGPSVHEHWHRFVSTVILREYDVSALPRPERWQFVDETDPNSSANFRKIVRRQVFPANGPFPIIESGSVKSYGHVYYEMPTSIQISDCEIIGVRGQANAPVAWTLVGVKEPAVVGDPNRAVVISRRRGTEFSRAILQSALEPYHEICLVIGGLDDDTQYQFAIDRGFAGIELVRPTAAFPVYPGPGGAPGRFLARVKVTGPDNLKPNGVGDISVEGLVRDQFYVEVEGDTAPILTSDYVGTEYWLVCQAPDKDPNDAYNLTVEICSNNFVPSQDTEIDAVVYGDIRLNHMLVVDRSGSMQYPDDGSGTKLEAVKSAVRLYTDAVNETDRIGLVWFSGDDVACSEDATTAEVLADATPGKRSAVKSDVNALFPSGWTSIGDGLWNAQDEFDALPAADENVNWLVLLSDGDENEARYWGSPIACAGDLGDAADDRIVPTETRVNAMAFGPESDQVLMQSIGNATNGDYSYIQVAEGVGNAPVLAAPTGNAQITELGGAYLGALKDACQFEQLFGFEDVIDGGVTENMNVPISEPGYISSVFVFNWSNDAANVTITLRDPSNSVIGAGQADIYTSSTHKVYHIDGELTQGVWTVEFDSNVDISALAGLFAKQGEGLQLITNVTQVNTGGPFDIVNQFGPYEHGVPVRLVAMLSDSNGPIEAAVVTAEVTMPDGTKACPLIKLYDDGAHSDGEPDDGVYAALFTKTTIAGSPQGRINDDPLNPNPGGSSGSYRVDFAVIKSTQSGDIQRVDRAYFNVNRTDTSLDDGDLDGLPDPWEDYYGTNPFVDDSGEDPDEDGLTHLQEFENGCHPFDEDTDRGGEQDGSEVSVGQCPLDPVDDRLPPPIGVAVEDRVGCTDPSILVPLANRLIFPVHPTYLQMQVFRSTSPDLSTFALHTTLPQPELQDSAWYDENLLDGETFYYRLRPIGASGARGRYSRVVKGTARVDPLPPSGSFVINNDNAATGSVLVELRLSVGDNVTHFFASNDPIQADTPIVWNEVPASGKATWVLDPPAPQTHAWVYMLFLAKNNTLSSEPAADAILYDPFSDTDNDGTPNAQDADDDDDGLLDVDEVNVHGTDPLDPDSDDDGLADGDEISGACTDPLDPDTDGDTLLDGADPSPSADVDTQHDVDMVDAQIMQQCLGQPVVGDCACLDFDNSGTIDGADYAAFLMMMTGPEQ